MPDPAPPTVAFGLAQPLRVGLAHLVRRPAATLLPVLLLLVPAVAVAVAALAVLRSGADAALTGLVAGAPEGAAGAVIVRPDAHGVRLLLALGVLLALVLTCVVLAGLVAGAVDRGATGVRARMARALRLWPTAALGTVAVTVVTCVLVAVVVVAASFAGRVRFQLTGVVLVVGLGALVVALVRLSLVPAVAARGRGGLLRAVRRTWIAGRGELIRLVLAAVVLVAAIAAPTALAWFLITTVLDALADAEVLDLSPVAVGLWALVPVPVGLLVAVAAWGVGARDVVDALDARDRSAGAARAEAGDATGRSSSGPRAAPGSPAPTPGA